MQELEIIDFQKMTIQEVRDFITSFEGYLKTLPQEELPLKHHFSKGVYARELHIPKGCMLTGKIHKFENLNILSKGEISILSQDGVMRVKAPFTVVSSPGVKRLAYAHEDCVWTTILGTDSKDHLQISEEFTTDDYSLVEGVKCHSQLPQS